MVAPWKGNSRWTGIFEIGLKSSGSPMIFESVCHLGKIINRFLSCAVYQLRRLYWLLKSLQLRLSPLLHLRFLYRIIPQILYNLWVEMEPITGQWLGDNPK